MTSSSAEHPGWQRHSLTLRCNSLSISQRVGKTIPQVTLFAFFIGFSLATGSLAETAAVAPKKTIVFLGDSITAGYGLAKGDAYPALIQKKIEEAGLPTK